MAYKSQVLNAAAGGTGIANGDSSTITLGGSLTTSGSFTSTFTMTNTTNVTFPTSGTLSTSTGTVTSVSGTSNQVSVATGTTTPVISLVGPYTPSTYTVHGVLVGATTSSIVATAAGATGTVLIGTTSADPSFSATPTLTSVTFGSGTALSVYQTGTWTPVLNFGGSTTGITYTTQEGRYAQIGNICMINARITLSSKGVQTGNATITGLPVNGSSVSGDNAVHIEYQSALTLTASYTCVLMTVGNGTATGTLFQTGSGQSIGNVTNSQFANTTDILITGIYRV